LIPPRTIHELSVPIQLKTTQDVLWPGHATKIRRVALVADMDVPSSASTAHAALRTRASCSVSACPTSASILFIAPLAAPLSLMWEERTPTS